jgi:hypothetical protein
VGGHGPPRAAEQDVQNESEGEQPHRPRELSRERPGDARGHRQARRGEECEDGGEETQTPPSRVKSADPLCGQGESGQEGEGEVERQWERPPFVGACTRPRKEAQHEGARARRAERAGCAEERQSGEGEERRRIMGDVANHESRDPRHHRLGPRGRAGPPGTGLPPCEQRRYQLRSSEQCARPDCCDQAPPGMPRVSLSWTATTPNTHEQACPQEQCSRPHGLFGSREQQECGRERDTGGARGPGARKVALDRE